MPEPVAKSLVVTMRILAPLRRRSVALVWSALAFSALGDQLNLVVLTWVAVDTLGPSASYLSAAKAAIIVVASLVGGTFAVAGSQANYGGGRSLPLLHLVRARSRMASPRAT